MTDHHYPTLHHMIRWLVHLDDVSSGVTSTHLARAARLVFWHRWTPREATEAWDLVNRYRAHLAAFDWEPAKAEAENALARLYQEMAAIATPVPMSGHGES